MSSKSEIMQLKQASRAASRSPKKSALSPLKALSSLQTPALSVAVLSKLRSERSALLTKVTTLEAQRDGAEALLKAEREGRKAEVDELKEKVRRLKGLKHCVACATANAAACFPLAAPRSRRCLRLEQGHECRLDQEGERGRDQVRQAGGRLPEGEVELRTGSRSEATILPIPPLRLASLVAVA